MLRTPGSSRFSLSRLQKLARFEADTFGLNLTNEITLALFAFLINPTLPVRKSVLQRTID
jgi:hypothetical protein